MAELFAVTEYVTVAPPGPDALTVIQLFEALAVHAHCEPVVTTVEPVPAPAGSVRLVGVNV